MLAPLLAASIIAGPTVADFFPMTPGTRRTYEERLQSVTVNVDEVGKPVEIGGRMATPIITTEGGKEISTSYYRLEGNTVHLVATNKEHPLPEPVPILQFEGSGSKWSYTGGTDDTKSAEPINMTGESKLVKERDVLGKKRAIIEVKLVTTVGGGRAQDKIEQVATYAQGVGLIQLKTTTRIGKRAASNELRLVKVEEAKTDG